MACPGRFRKIRKAGSRLVLQINKQAHGGRKESLPPCAVMRYEFAVPTGCFGCALIEPRYTGSFSAFGCSFCAAFEISVQLADRIAEEDGSVIQMICRNTFSVRGNQCIAVYFQRRIVIIHGEFSSFLHVPVK